MKLGGWRLKSEDPVVGPGPDGSVHIFSVQLLPWRFNFSIDKKVPDLRAKYVLKRFIHIAGAGNWDLL